MSGADAPGTSLWDLYRGEVDAHATTLTQHLLALEQQPADAATLAAMMRAAHSIKGAARIVHHALAVDLAHAVEERLVRARDHDPITPADVQRLLDAVDTLNHLSPADEAERDAQVAALEERTRAIIRELVETTRDDNTAIEDLPGATGESPTASDAGSADSDTPAPAVAEPAPATSTPRDAEASVRVAAQTLTRLLGLAGETVVANRWLGTHRDRLGGARKRLKDAVHLVEDLGDATANAAADPVRSTLVHLQRLLETSRAELTDMAGSLDRFTLRHEGIGERLHQAIQAARMRPFGEVVEGFPRLVRDLAKDLGKRVDLEIDGHATAVDREVADLLEAPLIQAIRNAIDHGIEPPAERATAGKPEGGTIRLAAKHRAGMLRVDVADDGRGVNTDAIRIAIVERGLATAALASAMDEDELMQFLFVPAFTTADEVSDISGRGVGLDVAAEAIRAAGGRVDVRNSPGLGFSLRFELPLTLSVLNALLVEIAGEPYAFPLSRLLRVELVPTDRVTVNGDARREIAFAWDSLDAEPGAPPAVVERRVPIAGASDLLGLATGSSPVDPIPLVVIGDERDMVALTVDRILGERSILVRPLDARLGKVQDVAAGGLTVDGVPVLVLDAEDLVTSSRHVHDMPTAMPVQPADDRPAAAKRVLVVDDSPTVREVERQVLQSAGYTVETAGDGMEAWHAVRSAPYDLVVADIDMPRMDGLTLLRHIRQDRRLSRLPVLVLSYQDTDEDRQRARWAGASAFLGKGSFDDQRFLDRVARLLDADSTTHSQ